MTRRSSVFILCLLIGTASLFIAFSLSGYWVGAAAALGLAYLGWYGWHGLKKPLNAWSADLYLGAAILLVTIAAFLDLKVYLLFIAVVCAIGAWDLTRFDKRLTHSPSSEDIPRIEKRHLTLLGITGLAAGLMALLIGTIRLQLNFSISLVLGIGLVISLGQIIRFFRK